MEYLIVGGLGLSVGIALMIWALSERSKRHKAEDKARQADLFRSTAETIANQNKERAADLEKKLHAVNMQVGAMRGRLNETRNMLAKSTDPNVIKIWLDAELEKYTL